MADIVFIKNANGTVTITEGGTIIKCLQPTLHVICDPQKPEVLIVSVNINSYRDPEEYKFKFASVVTPAHTDKADLISKLCSGFFDGAIPISVALSATSINGINSFNAPTGTGWVGDVWTGAGEQNNFQFLGINLQVDEVGTLTLEFSQDGTNWSEFPTEEFEIASGINEVHTAWKGNRYVRPIFTGAGGRTFFRLQTYYAHYPLPLSAPLNQPINSDQDASVTRSVITGERPDGTFANARLTAAGTQEMTIKDANTGAQALVDKNGALKVGESIIMAGDVFGGIIPSDTLWQFSGNGANVTQAGNERVETGTIADGSRQMQTFKRARFMGSQFNVYHTGLKLPDLTNADTIYRWGVFNPIGTANGAYFEVLGGVSPVWTLVTVKNDVPTPISQGSWTGTGVTLFNAIPGLAVYEIIYNAGTISFLQGPNLLHTQTVNTLGQTYANQYHFNVGVEVENINGNTANNGIEVYAAVVYRNGEERGELISRAYTTDQLVKRGAGYVGTALLSRSGSVGGSGTMNIYDGIDNTGILIGNVTIGGADSKPVTMNGTVNDGIFIEVTGSGTNTVTINFE